MGRVHRRIPAVARAAVIIASAVTVTTFSACSDHSEPRTAHGVGAEPGDHGLPVREAYGKMPFPRALYDLGHCMMDAAQATCTGQGNMPARCNVDPCERYPGLDRYRFLAGKDFDYFGKAYGPESPYHDQLRALERHCPLASLLSELENGRLTKIRSKHPTDIRGCRLSLKFAVIGVSAEDRQEYKYHVYRPCRAGCTGPPRDDWDVPL